MYVHACIYVYSVAVPSVVLLLPVCSGYRILLNFAGPSWTADPSYQQQLRYGRHSSSFPHPFVHISRDVCSSTQSVCTYLWLRKTCWIFDSCFFIIIIHQEKRSILNPLLNPLSLFIQFF